MNIGILGFGAMGKVHAWCIQNLPFFFGELPFQARIVGLNCAHPEKAVAACRLYSLGKVYDGEDAMLADPQIDIIDVCTPNIYHYDTVKKAILAGKNVYCEKPLCVNSCQAQELVQLAKSRKRICGIVFNNRFMAPVLRAKQIITGGGIGKPVSFRFSYLHDTCSDPDAYAGWKQEGSISGGGVLLDLGSHVLDLVTWLCGKTSAISAQCQTAHPLRRSVDGKMLSAVAEEACYMTLRLENGAYGTVEANKLATGTNDDLSFEIYGERGALRYYLMQPNYLYYYDKAKDRGELGGNSGFRAIECVGRYPVPGGTFPSSKAPSGWLRGHIGCMFSYLCSAYEKKTPSPSFQDGAYVTLLTDAAYRSTKNSGAVVHI